GLGELRARHTNSRINEHFSVRARQNGNIATGALKHAHIPAQVMRRYRRGRGTVLDKGYNPTRLRKSLARCEPATGGRKGRARHAAETKMAARKQVFLSQIHGFLLTVLRFPQRSLKRRRAWTRSFLVSRGETAARCPSRIATPQRCRLVGARFTGLRPALERRLIASPTLRTRHSWRARLAHSSLGDLHESLLDELCRSRHGIRIDLDVWQQVLV